MFSKVARFSGLVGAHGCSRRRRSRGLKFSGTGQQDVGDKVIWTREKEMRSICVPNFVSVGCNNRLPLFPSRIALMGFLLPYFRFVRILPIHIWRY